MLSAEPTSFTNEESFAFGTISHTAAAARNSSIFTDSLTNGSAQSAHTATRLSAPAEFLIIDAALRTVDAASDIIPPTTGRVVDITVRAVLTATASTPLVTMPVSPM